MFHLKEVGEVADYLEGLHYMPRNTFVRLAANIRATEGYRMQLRSLEGFDNDRLTCTMDVIKDKDSFCITGYRASKLTVPEIPVVVSGSFDSRSFEHILADIDFDMPHHIFIEQPGAMDTYLDLRNATGNDDPLVREAASLLLIKYVKNTLLEDSQSLNIDAGSYETNMLVELANSKNDIKPLHAYNLLCGRSVLQIDERMADGMYWNKLVDGELKEIRENDITGVLNRQGIVKPATNMGTAKFLGELFNGSMPRAAFMHGGKMTEGHVAYDPVSQRFLLFDGNKKPLDDIQARKSLAQRPMVKKRPGRGRGI